MMGAARRLAIPLVVLALWLALQIWFFGFGVRAAIGFCGALVIWLSPGIFPEQVRRPWRDYAIVAALSAFAGLLLFPLVLNPFMLALWLACTGFGVFWVWHWDRAERLASEG